MPLNRVNDINLYYEVHGEGPNLVLIEGLGYDLWMWYRQLPVLSREYRVLIYDNRGVGRSDKPPGPYSHAQNAADLAGLLDHLGWDRASILGVSMGGFIAQEFALAYPQRVEALILACTMLGGPSMVPLSPEAARALIPDTSLEPEVRIRTAMRLAFGDPTWPESHPAEMDQIVAWRLEYPQPPEAAYAQAMAALTFHTEDRLGAIAAPTLVLAGTEDHVVPPENAQVLASAIPGAHFKLIPGAGHVLLIDHAAQFNDMVLDFLGEHVIGQPTLG